MDIHFNRFRKEYVCNGEEGKDPNHLYVYHSDRLNSNREKRCKPFVVYQSVPCTKDILKKSMVGMMKNYFFISLVYQRMTEIQGDTEPVIEPMPDFEKIFWRL